MRLTLFKIQGLKTVVFARHGRQSETMLQTEIDSTETYSMSYAEEDLVQLLVAHGNNSATLLLHWTTPTSPRIKDGFPSAKQLREAEASHVPNR